MNDTTTIGVPRRALSFAAAAGLALAGTVTLAAGSQSAPAQPGEHKVWVCKYVDKPGVAERLKAGKQPIYVDWHSLTGKSGPPKVGDTFSDAQVKSVVVQVGGSDPGAAACAGSTTTTTTTTTTTSSTTSSTTSTTSTSAKAHPHKPKPPAKPKAKPPAQGGGVTPGVTAPQTGGSGEDGTNPANGLIGSGFLLAAAGVLANDLLKRRREATNSR